MSRDNDKKGTPSPNETSTFEREDWCVVGHSVEKVDALGLATGAPAFVDDMPIRGLLHGAILASPYAHARIRRIDTSKAEQLPGVHAVLCHKNVPRVPHTTAGQSYPEPSPYDTYMFDAKVRFVGDRVAAVAAESREIAHEALRLIEVDYDVLEPVLDARKAMDQKSPTIHDEPDATTLIPMDFDAISPPRSPAASGTWKKA